MEMIRHQQKEPDEPALAVMIELCRFKQSASHLRLNERRRERPDPNVKHGSAGNPQRCAMPQASGKDELDHTNTMANPPAIGKLMIAPGPRWYVTSGRVPTLLRVLRATLYAL